MAEMTHTASSQNTSVMVPGRHGRADGGPGVIVRERRGAAFAWLTARPGGRPELTQAIQSAFGIGLPDVGKRIAGKRLALTGTGPDRWLAEVFEVPVDGIEAVLRHAIGSTASAVDQSHANVIVRVQGKRVREALATGIPIDLHPRAFAVGHCAQTVCAHIGVLVWRLTDGAGGEPAFEMATPRSSFGSFWHWLEAGALRYGLEVAVADST